jgi:DNA-binding transcriptional LysR family regulator
MDLRHLRYFIRVAEELHFGRAAAALGISQPPLSQQIRALEEELGIDLFDRTSRRVRLTEAGDLFLIEARRTLVQAARAVAVVQRVRHGETGELAIGFNISAPFVSVVSRTLSDFRAAYPAIHLTIGELNRAQQLAGLADNRYDLGFVRGNGAPPLPQGLAATLLLEEGLLIAMRDDHPLAALDRPLTLDDIADESFVLYRRDVGAGFNEQLERLVRGTGRELHIAQEVSGLSSQLGLVAAGFGLTVLVRSLAALQIDRIVYRPIAADGATSQLWLVRREKPSTAAQRFSEMLIERCSAEWAD